MTAANLTPAQLEGMACIRCGACNGDLQPVAIVSDDVQLYECASHAQAKPMPSWQTSPCPAWCTTTHRDSDEPADRYHMCDSAHVPLSLEKAELFTGRPGDPRAVYLLPELVAALLQPYREAEPMVEILDDRDVYNVRLTLGEAEAFGRALLALVEQARNGGAA